VKFRCVGFKQLAHCGDVFVSEMAAVPEVGAQKRVFLLDVANADCQRKPTTAQVTDRRSLLGDEQRIALREYENPGPEPNPAGTRCEIAQRGE